ncbi:MAG: hypothetical protein Q7R41_13590 [Phycisphaerales bacterium]|nr:hypothetical protein [Phycisphaerales bacterium]
MPFACFLIVLSIAAVGAVSRYALLTALVDALSAAVIVVPAALGGLWLTSLFRLGPLPRRWQLIFGAALGLGAMAILVLVGGLLGLLNRTLWIVLLCAFAASGVVRLRRIPPIAQDEKCAAPGDRDESAARWRLLWIVAAPFLTLALLAASNAPGFIWQEEGNGYDVLEYHLQLPKEYLQGGRIVYQPHNVYANFPANVEMLYLLAMVVHGDPLEAGTVGNMIHLLLAALTVAAAWAIGRDGSPRAGVVCGVMAATTGWLEYLSGLAYVENGMLFFGMCAAAAMLRAVVGCVPDAPCSIPKSSNRRTEGCVPGAPYALLASPIRWAALSGVLAGLACGCKYTAVALIALPLLPAVALMPFRLSEKIKAGLVFVLGTLVAFSPWLVKNQLMTGNPVFPLTNDLFRATPQGWSAEQTQQWDRGHALTPEERTFSARVRSLWVRVAGDAGQRFGPTILALGLVGLLSRRRDRADAALVLMLALQVAVWTMATHEYARFAVPLIIPLAILGGRALSATDDLRAANFSSRDPASNSRAVLVAAVIVGGAAWNLAFAAVRHARESPGGAPPALFYEGRVPGFEYLGFANEELPENAKVLLVGESRAFYFRRKVDYCVAFNRSPFLEMIHAADALPGLTTRATRATGVMDWLGGRGYTHVLVNWSEVRRLERTYGLAPPTTAAQLKRAMARLAQEGLSLVRAFNHPNPEVHARYVELYAVPPDRQAP